MQTDVLASFAGGSSEILAGKLATSGDVSRGKLESVFPSTSLSHKLQRSLGDNM